jgi:multidrug efflux system membrane fusion protein
MSSDQQDQATAVKATTSSFWDKMPIGKSVFTSLFVLIALVAWLFSGWLSDSSKELAVAKPLKDTMQEANRFKVVVQALEARPYLNKINLQARSEADKVVTIAAETNGTISALPVDKGAFVQANQTICKIDIGARKAQLDEAKAMRDARQIEFDAATKLTEQGHVSKSQLAASRAAYDASKAAVKGRQVELSRATIKAPFDGILDRLPVKVGDFISVGQPCATIIDKDPLLVVGHIAENQVNSIGVGAIGEAAFVTGETVRGKVRYIAETPHLTTRTFRVELEIDNKDLLLRDGVSAELTLQTGDVLATRIPQGILTMSDDGKLGVRVIDEGRVAFRDVTIVADNLDGVLVTGLRARENVIIAGGEYTRDGRQVDFEFAAPALADVVTPGVEVR